MVVIFNSRTEEKETKTCTEKTFNLAEFIEEAERLGSPWLIEDKDVRLRKIELKRKGRSDLKRIATWTMVGVLGTITIASIATGNEKLMTTLAAAAAVFLARLVYSGVTRHGKRRNTNSPEPGDDPDDS